MCMSVRLLLGISVGFIGALMLTIVITETYCAIHPLYEHQNRLKHLLFKFDRLCRSEKLEYWLDSGSLLGLVREGGFIVHDDDIDVVVKESVVAHLTDAAIKAGFSLRPFIAESTGILRFRCAQLGCELDVFPLRENPRDGSLTYSRGARKLWPRFVYDGDLDIADFSFGKFRNYADGIVQELVVRAPVDGKKYVERFYGTSWTVPVVTHTHTLSGFRNSFFYGVGLLLLSVPAAVLVGIVLYQNDHGKLK